MGNPFKQRKCYTVDKTGMSNYWQVIKWTLYPKWISVLDYIYESLSKPPCTCTQHTFLNLSYGAPVSAGKRQYH